MSYKKLRNPSINNHVYNDKWLVQYETEAARDDDNQNTKNEIVFSLSKFCHKIFKYRKAFLDYLDDYTD